MRTLVIIPTYNEKDNIATAVTETLAQGPEFSVLVVDDASPDGTGAIADNLAKENPERVFVMHRAAKSGLGSAYIAGFRFGLDGGFAALCEMDADGSHDPKDLPRLLAAVRDGAGLAIGSRRVTGGRIIGWGWKRHLLSWGAANLSRLLLRLTPRDVTAGFRCYSAAAATVVRDAPIRGLGYSFQEESLLYVERNKFKVLELPVTFRDRVRGGSKLGWLEVWKSLRHLLEARRHANNLKNNPS